LRTNKDALKFITDFSKQENRSQQFAMGLLISAGLVNGRKMTSYPSIKIDLINAGAEWHDKVVIGGLVTSRNQMI
jgi:protease I